MQFDSWNEEWVDTIIRRRQLNNSNLLIGLLELTEVARRIAHFIGSAHSDFRFLDRASYHLMGFDVLILKPLEPSQTAIQPEQESLESHSDSDSSSVTFYGRTF